MTEKFWKIEDNKIGLYPHTVAVVGSGIGKLLVIDYQSMNKTSSLLLSQLYNPVRVSLIKEGLSDA